MKPNEHEDRHSNDVSVWRDLRATGAKLLRYRAKRLDNGKVEKDPSKRGGFFSDWYEIKRGGEGCAAVDAAAHYGCTYPADPGSTGGVGTGPLAEAGLIAIDVDVTPGAPESTQAAERYQRAGAAEKHLGAPHGRQETPSGGEHLLYRIPEGVDPPEDCDWRYGEVRCKGGWLAVYDPSQLVHAANHTRRISMEGYSRFLAEHGVSGKAERRRAREKGNGATPPPAGKSESSPTSGTGAHGPMIRRVGAAVRRGEEVDVEAEVKKLLAEGSTKRTRETAEDEVRRAIAGAKRKLESGEWKRSRKRSPRVPQWTRFLPDGLPVLAAAYEGEPDLDEVLEAAREERRGLALLAWDDTAGKLAPDPGADPARAKLQTTNDEDGLDAALAFLGIRVRANLRAHRALEVVGGLAGERWIPYDDGVDAAISKLIHKRCRTKHQAPSGGVYWKPLRIAIQTVANWCTANTWGDRTVDPFLEWLEARAPWDNVPRLGAAVGAVFVPAPGQDIALCEWASGAPLVAAAARALEPGALADTVCGLHGPQGMGKSRFYRDVFPAAVRKQWFTDSLPLDGDDKVWGERRAAKVIVEAAELDGLHRANEAKLKALISRRVLRYRRAYGRVATDFALRDVVVGSSNDERPLPNSASGNRRWCLIHVTAIRKGGWAWLEANRDQLWAEAFARAKGGEEGNVPPALAEAQAAHNEPLRAANLDLEDGLEELEGWLDAEPRTTAEVVGELMRRDCLAAGMTDERGPNGEPSRITEKVATAIEGARRTDRHSKAVAHALTALGWSLVKSGGRRTWRRTYRHGDVARGLA